MWWIFQVIGFTIAGVGVWLAWIWNEIHVAIIFVFLLWGHNISQHAYDNYVKDLANKKVKQFINMFKAPIK